jgi:iron-sulfur cluster repair protein YtfE (RIC family)
MKRRKDPIAELMQEHNEALIHLKSLTKSTQAFSQEGFTPGVYKNVLSALRYIEQEVTQHNKKEEEALFPILERYVEGPTRVMRADHKKLRKGFVRLRNCVDRVNKHRDSFSAIHDLSIVSKNVVQLFVNHIHKENHILFPLVQQFLSKDEMREVARKML